MGQVPRPKEQMPRCVEKSTTASRIEKKKEMLECGERQMSSRSRCEDNIGASLRIEEKMVERKCSLKKKGRGK